MSTQQHTPGPLHCMPAASMSNCNDATPMAGVFTDDDGVPDELIATFIRDEDARLFAAAADLLGALSAFKSLPFRLAQEPNRVWTDIDALYAARLFAKAAIAKATGEALS